MKWVVRILAATLLLIIIVGVAVWYNFPRYAQSLIDRAVEGTGIRVEMHNPGLPNLSGMDFGRLDIVFQTPSDSCSNTSSRYTAVVHNGSLFWTRPASGDPLSKGLLPEILPLGIELRADSISIEQHGTDISFSDNLPVITGKLSISRRKGAALKIIPDSFSYNIENGRLVSDRLRLDSICYAISLTSESDWVQQPALLSIASLHTEEKAAPLNNFTALFGMQRDPDNPCVMSLSTCSVELFGLRASTPEIDYDLQNKQTSFTLVLQDVPLEKLPGFKGADSSRPLASGLLNGTVPVEFRDSTLSIQNASIRADSDTRLRYYSPDGSPLLSIEAVTSGKSAELFRNLDATIILNSDDEKVSGFALENVSSTFLGGNLSSGPARYDPVEKKSSFTLELKNVRLPEHIRLHGDFSGSLKGALSGSVPITVKKGAFSINKARLSSTGSGSITHAPPRKKRDSSDSRFGTPKPDANYAYSKPDLVISRNALGKTTVGFTLHTLRRNTSGGELLLTDPEGQLTLWQDKNNPSLVSLSEFSAGLMGGSVSIDKVDYDMGKQTAETVLVLDSIPLQKLLDLQGMKKIFATGTVAGKIPLIMKDQKFEIPAGKMDALQNGQIIYTTTPEERAAANESMRITYEALSNFLYSELISSITMAPDGQSLIRLQLKGTNPSFQEGRPVHLNLSVEQNLLDLFRSLSISTNIEEAISEKALQKQSK